MLDSIPSQHKLGIRTPAYYLSSFLHREPHTLHAQVAFLSRHAGFSQVALGLQTAHVKLSGKKRAEKVN